ncbi:pilin [Diaphorobacter sp. JS3051]|uniref:pilin n=1 Tax=Diaphorobacter sp. JS3051 TaxID=2792224 RepID=UPI0018C9BEE4|nr:pilin [Diaphorobacter sp. JS3051]
MTAAGTGINTTPTVQKASKYVRNFCVDATPGDAACAALADDHTGPWQINVAIAATAANGIPTGLHGHIISFVPAVQGVTPTAASSGAIDWACGSSTTTTAKARFPSLTVTVPATALQAKYAPAECR